MNGDVPGREENFPAAERTPELSIVMVGWNTRAFLEPCLESIYLAGLQTSFEVIVVDNASIDGSQDLVRRRFPQVRLLENRVNTGFAEASNQGAREARGDFVLLLNSDTLVNAPSLDALVEFMRQTPDAGAAGGKLLNPDGSFQGAYAEFSCLAQELLIALRVGAILWPGYPSHKSAEAVTPVDWLSAACLMVRRRVFTELGYLDNEYFMYGEEVDLEFRMKRAGWKVYYLPHVYTVHYGGGSQDRWRRRKMVYRGKILFYRKHYGRVREFFLRALFGAISLVKLLLWATVCVVPRGMRRAGKEMQSNGEVLQLCLWVR